MEASATITCRRVCGREGTVQATTPRSCYAHSLPNSPSGCYCASLLGADEAQHIRMRRGRGPLRKASRDPPEEAAGV